MIEEVLDLPVEEGLEIMEDLLTVPVELASDKHPPLFSLEDRVPKFNLIELKSVREALRKLFVPEWKHSHCDMSFIEDILFPSVRDIIPNRVPSTPLKQTLRNHLFGRGLAKYTWDLLATRLAGNLYWMRYEALTSIHSLQHCQWVVLETLEARTHRPKQGGRPVALFEYRVRTGQWAGCHVKKALSVNFLPTYGDCLGLGQWRWKKQPRLYTNMNLFAYLAPADRVESLTFTKIYSSSGCKAINKFYAKGRNDPCVCNFNHTCWFCPRGQHGEKEWQCKFATHQRPWERRECPECKKERWYYVDTPKGRSCVICSEGRSR